MISVDTDDFRNMMQQLIDYRKRVQELLESNTKEVLARRAVDWCMETKSMFFAFRQDVPERPGWAPEDVMEMRIKLMVEEFEETMTAIEEGNFVEFIDGCIDLIVVTIGAMIACGVDGRPIWTEVMKTNFAKASGPKREDGKIMKPAGWTPPDVRGELIKQGWVPDDEESEE